MVESAIDTAHSQIAKEEVTRNSQSASHGEFLHISYWSSLKVVAELNDEGHEKRFIKQQMKPGTGHSVHQPEDCSTEHGTERSTASLIVDLADLSVEQSASQSSGIHCGGPSERSSADATRYVFPHYNEIIRSRLISQQHGSAR